MSSNTFLPEWAPQDAVMLAWPHATTDWAPWLAEIEQTYIALVKAIAQCAHPLVLVQDQAHQQHIMALLGQVEGKSVLWELGPYNDTWCRDYGPLTVGGSESLTLMDFCFSGWGDKYEASDDDAVNARLAQSGRWQQALRRVEVELEGGSVESDGLGTLMTTETCLLGGNRNESLSREQLEDTIKSALGVQRILWIKNGYLCGDDTDSHVDNLVRFADADTLVYATCENTLDEHYAPLKAMEEEIRMLRKIDGEPYRLIALPIPSPRIDENGKRLPASYVNFLIVNQHVIVPTFGTDDDTLALSRLRDAFPAYEILSVPGGSLIKQFGGPHCATMQLPRGTINKGANAQ